MTEERATNQKITITPDEAAGQLGVSRPTLMNWIHMSGGIPHFYAGRRILIPRQALVEWAHKQAEMRAVL